MKKKGTMEFRLISTITINALSNLFPPEEYAVIRSDADMGIFAMVNTAIGNIALGVVNAELSMDAIKEFLGAINPMKFSTGLLISTMPYPEEMKDMEHDWVLGEFVFQVMDVGEAIHMAHVLTDSEEE